MSRAVFGVNKGCFKARLVLFFVSFIVTGCASYVPYTLPEDLPEPESTPSAWLDSEKHAWWLAFNNQDLNHYVSQALKQNMSLQAAKERVRAARAIARSAAAQRLPGLDANLEWTHQDDTQVSRSYSAGLSASYEADVWGRLDNSHVARQLLAEASEQAYQAVALSLSADVAIAWMRLSEAEKQLSLLNSQLGISNQVLQVLNVRFEVGQAQSEDILRQELAVESVRADIISTTTRIQVLKNQLAVLLGTDPRVFQVTGSPELPSLLQDPDQEYTTELLQRRPDVQQAYLNLLAADKELAAAVKDQYPRLNLSLSLASQAGQVSGLFSDWISTLVVGISSPIFDGGQRRSEVIRNTAVRDEQLANYQQVVLQAIADTQTAQFREQQQFEQLFNLRDRLALSRAAYERIEVRYLNGGTEFLTLLSAQDQYQTLERDVLAGELLLLEYRIALYRELAGSW